MNSHCVEIPNRRNEQSDLTQPFLNLSKTTSVSAISNAARMTFVPTRPPQKLQKMQKVKINMIAEVFARKMKKVEILSW